MTRTSVFIAFFLSFISLNAHAIKTSSSFDVSWATCHLSTAVSSTTGDPIKTRAIDSTTGIQIDYNVALFDYSSVAFISFTQFEFSSAGKSPFSRLAFGGAYHFGRINGQRMLLDNQVESKVWGVSPSVELSVGINKLTVNSSDPSFNFATSSLDAIPRFAIEIPLSPTFLLILKAGYYTTVQANSLTYKIVTTGSIFNIGFKLATL